MDINKRIQLAVDYYRAGNILQAENLLKENLQVQPNNVDTLNLLAIISYKLKDYDASIKYIKRLINLNPNNAQSHYILGHSLQEKGEVDEAIIHYQKSLSINPDFTDVYYNLGTIFQDKKRNDEAISCYQKALQLNPNDVDAYYNLGRVLQDKELFNEAIACYQRALQLNPNLADAHNNIGTILQEKEQFDEAMSYCQKALQLNPNLADAHNNIGTILQEKEQFDEAINCFHKAVQISPTFYKAFYNIGNSMQEKGQIDESITYYQKALALNPNDADVHFGLGTTFMLLGKFSQGLKEYEWRFQTKDFCNKSCFRQPSSFSQPLWNGSSLEGKSILIFAEQGVGDEIMFASCFQEIIEQAGECFVECDKRLIPIFARSFPKAVLIERLNEAYAYSSKLPQKIDMVIPIGSLPKFLRTDFKAFPQKSYLIPDADKVQAWRNHLKTLGEGLKVGISWRGGVTPKVRRKRSIKLEQWAKLFSLSGIHFINLQYGECKDELKEVKENLGITIHDWEDANPFKDLDNFAAQISALDLVISVDNSTVHLAGALGMPVWTLLPFVPDWRWMLKFEDTPWYPTMRLFRQQNYGNWNDVFRDVYNALQDPLKDKYIAVKKHKSSATTISYTSLNNEYLRNSNKKRVVLLNDTLYWYHWGCTGTSTAIHQTISGLGYEISSVSINSIYNCKDAPISLKDFDDPDFFQQYYSVNKGIIEIIKDVEVVVVNGEGSLHGINPNVLNLLYLAYLSKVQLGKNVQIINHSCYPEHTIELSNSLAWEIFKKVYRVVDFIAIREPISFDLIKSAGIPAVLSFDCLPLYITKNYSKGIKPKTNKIILTSSMGKDIDFKTICSYIDYLNKLGYEIQVLTGASAFPSQDDIIFIEILSGLCADSWTLVTAKSIDEWLDIISTARLLVSGRFHHTIAASVLGTPFVLLASNTPKNAGLAKTLHTKLPLSHGDVNFFTQLINQTNIALSEKIDYKKDEHDSIIDSLCELSQKNFMMLEKMAIHKTTISEPSPFKD
jgi:tetratricopeptide (TPR) repeat protein/polysaccharide pyruvyl transferase WcaK-like protein